MKLRFSIRDLLWLTLVVALGITIYQLFWDSNATNTLSPLSDNYRFVLAVYLGLLSIATVGCRHRAQVVRNFCIGYAVFGWVYLICVLHGGIVAAGSFDEMWLQARYSLMGAPMGILVGFATCFLNRNVQGNYTANEEKKSG